MKKIFKFIPIYFIYIWLIFFAIFPLSLMFIISFFTKNSINLFSLPLTFNNYKELFLPIFAKIFFKSLFIALLTTILCLTIAYPFSYILVKSKYQSLLLIFIIIPFWTNSLIRTYSLIAIFKCKGIINNVLFYLHIIKTPLHILYSNYAVLIGLVYNLLPFMVLPLFTNMKHFNFELIDAAKDLGANKWVVFYYIFLPNTIPGIISGCLLVFLPSMTLFYIPNILGGAKSMLLGNFIQNQFLSLENWPKGSATNIILSIFSIIIFIFYHYKNNKK
ncbi:spermidine/putrescine ABC transporter permease [Candidatus Legionella polyplacis]|nr:ABC transporter permease subunit [Candidatus Legionella polyplacis]ATW01634.1 spermidine/putrescine ABC transporter permease [Candidatus Legionella polyplacis]